MPVIAGLAPAASAPQSMLGQLGGDAFLKLLVAQLRFQNPMSPSDPSAMLQQTAQFTQVEALQRLSEAQQQLLGLSHATIASGLIGKEVTADVDAGEITGTVHGIRFSAGGPVLLVGEHDVPLGSVTEVHDPA